MMNDLDTFVDTTIGDWSGGLKDVSSARAAMTAAFELAGRAFNDKDATARAQAEEVLYRLSLGSKFAVPFHPVAAFVWTHLMQRKLASVYAQFGGSEPMSKEEMRARLEAEVAELGAFNHHVLDQLSGAPERRSYQVWAKNWFGSCHGFSHQLASLVQRTTGKTKEVVLENLADEFTHKNTHDDLRGRFYNSIGLSFDPHTAHADPDWRIESTALLNLRTGLCVLADPWPALGCFYSVEANWPPECRRHIEITRELGCNSEEIEYWTEHGEADEDHSAEWLSVLEAQCTSDADRARVVDGALMQLKTRRLMYDAISVKLRDADLEP